VRLKAVLWWFENIIHNLPEKALRVPKMAGSSDHLMYTQNIKEKEKKGFSFDYRYCNITIINPMSVNMRILQNRVQWRTINTKQVFSCELEGLKAKSLFGERLQR